MDDQCTQMPLVERLRRVPANAVLRIDTPNALPGCFDSESFGVGRMCHEAAAELSKFPPLPVPANEAASWTTDEAMALAKSYGRDCYLQAIDDAATACERYASDQLRDQPMLRPLLQSSHGYEFARLIRALKGT